MPSIVSRPSSLPHITPRLQFDATEENPLLNGCEETFDSYHRRILIRAVPHPPSGVQDALTLARSLIVPAARMGATPVRWVTYPLHGALCEGIIGGATGVVVGSDVIHLLFQAWQRESFVWQGLPNHIPKALNTAQASYLQAAIYSAVLVTVLSGSAVGASCGMVAGAVCGGVRGLADVRRNTAAIFETQPPPHPQ